LEDLPFEAAERVLQRLAFLESYFCQRAPPAWTDCKFVIVLVYPFLAFDGETVVSELRRGKFSDMLPLT
jgi:hypothetical protein